MGDVNPLFAIREFSASQLNNLREQSFADYPKLKPDYFAEFEQSEGTQNFLNGFVNYPLLKGIQTNLFKCFLPQAWMAGNVLGVSGFLHPEGIYNDPKGGFLRAIIYSRLRAHFQFSNEKNLFSEVQHQKTFSINIYGDTSKQSFQNIANLFIPQTIDQCFQHDGLGAVPTIKTDDGRWNTNGHKDRIISVDKHTLALFAKLYGDKNTPPLQACLPALHSRQLINVLEKFSQKKKRLGDLRGEYYSLEMWHETNSQQDGTIKRQTKFPENSKQWILSGPHFFVGTPFYKTPRAKCVLNADYDVLDFTVLPDDYLPRTNYTPACGDEEYHSRIQLVPWIEEGATEPKRVTDYNRLVFRKMVDCTAERTVSSAIFPQNVAHIHGVKSYIFKDIDLLLLEGAYTASLPFDFLFKSTGKSNFHNALEDFPLMKGEFIDNYLKLRIINLSCLTNIYADLWKSSFQYIFTQNRWAKSDDRLPNDFFRQLTGSWQRKYALRTDFNRRQALVEIDVLSAMSLDLTQDELQAIYRVQFPVMRQNEQDTWYDRAGRIVFTVSKGLVGVGLPRKANRNDTPCQIKTPPADIKKRWLDWCAEHVSPKNGQFVIDTNDWESKTEVLGWEDVQNLDCAIIERTILDDTVPNGPIERLIQYVAPFDLCSREQDYQTVWQHFEQRFAANTSEVTTHGS